MKKFKYSEITPEKIYENRRSFVKSLGFGAGSMAISSLPFLNNAIVPITIAPTKSIDNIITNIPILGPIILFKDPSAIFITNKYFNSKIFIWNFRYHFYLL